MKNLMVAVGLLSVMSIAHADKYVNGYVKQDGTYVQPHYQTAPNQNRYDNYSSQGNVNPYTGQQGHERNEFSTPPAYNRTNPYAAAPALSNPYSSGYNNHQ